MHSFQIFVANKKLLLDLNYILDDFTYTFVDNSSEGVGFTNWVSLIWGAANPSNMHMVCKIEITLKDIYWFEVVFSLSDALDILPLYLEDIMIKFISNVNFL
jgi:hypothetical protein